MLDAQRWCKQHCIHFQALCTLSARCCCRRRRRLHHPHLRLDSIRYDSCPNMHLKFTLSSSLLVVLMNIRAFNSYCVICVYMTIWAISIKRISEKRCVCATTLWAMCYGKTDALWTWETTPKHKERTNERTNERKKHNNTNVKQVSKRVDSIIFKSYDSVGAVVIIVYWADIKLYPLGDWLPKIYKIRATTVSSLLKSTPF